jgi:hypothetical protein
MGMHRLVRQVRPEEWLTIRVGGEVVYIQLTLQRGTARTQAAIHASDAVQIVHTRERPTEAPQAALAVNRP